MKMKIVFFKINKVTNMKVMKNIKFLIKTILKI